jgi:putative acetyltransferase
MIIRNENPSDYYSISDLTEQAFKDHPISDNTEHFIIDALRAAGALSISLVAEVDEEVVGHVAFSPVNFSDGAAGWYGLGPVAVLPEHQFQGIGQSMIREGLSRLKALKANGCVLVGDPVYYARFGFKNYPGIEHEGVPSEYVLALPFNGSIPQGRALFHKAFQAKR